MKTAEPPRMPLSSAPLWPLSVAAYHTLGEAGLIPKQTELLYGFVYRKMPKSPFHCFLLQKILEALIRISPLQCLVRSEQPITCADSEPEPDISVVRGRAEDFRASHPRTAELVMEICVTSEDYDRSKIPAYAAARVIELWLVLADRKQIEIHRQPSGDRYLQCITLGPGGCATSEALPEVAIDLSAVFTP